MVDTTRVLVALALVAAVTVLVIAFVRSFMGKSVRGTLHVPQGKQRVAVQVRDDSKLRPYRFGQTFEAAVVPDGDYGMALQYKGATIGAVDGQNSRAQALRKLADAHRHVLVSVNILSIDEQQRPLMHMMLPEPSWFKRALS